MIRERNRPCPFEEVGAEKTPSPPTPPRPPTAPPPPPPPEIEIVGFHNNEYYEGRNIELANLEEIEFSETETISSVIYNVLDSKKTTTLLITQVNNNRRMNFRTNFILLPKLIDQKVLFKITLLKQNGQIFKEITYPTEITLKKMRTTLEQTETGNSEQPTGGETTPTTTAPAQETHVYNPIIRGLISGNPQTYVAGNNISIINFDPGTNKVAYNYRIGNDYRGLKNITNNTNSFSVSFNDIPPRLNNREGILTATLYKQNSSSFYKTITIDRVKARVENPME